MKIGWDKWLLFSHEPLVQKITVDVVFWWFVFGRSISPHPPISLIRLVCLFCSALQERGWENVAMSFVSSWHSRKGPCVGPAWLYWGTVGYLRHGIGGRFLGHWSISLKEVESSYIFSLLFPVFLFFCFLFSLVCHRCLFLLYHHVVFSGKFRWWG